MAAAKFTRATPVTCATCGCVFTPVAYRPDRHKVSHSPGRKTCSDACRSKRLSQALSIPLEDRFWSKVDKRSDNECWPWSAARHPFGYGSLTRSDGGTQVASRIAYELTYGPVPKGVEVRHKCDFPPCCNPRHLETGTHKQNMEDMSARGRAAISEETKKKLSAAMTGRKLTDAHRAKLSAAKLGKASLKRKAICINGVVFSSLAEARAQLRIAQKTITKMLASGAACYV